MSAVRETLVIEAGRTERHYWRDLWRYRELLYFLSWRDILVRYKDTTMGIAWALLRPLSTMTVFTVVFSVLARVPSEGDVPYSLLVLVGLLPWQFFASAVGVAGASLVDSERMITKIYFPRMIIPMSAMLVAMVDFTFAGVLLGAFFAWYGIVPGWRVLFLPLFFLLAVLAALGPGLLFSALNVKYRDFRHVVPFIVQIGLYVSPVAYSSTLVPERWRLLYAVNPMVGVIEGFRWTLFGGQSALHVPNVLMSVAITALLLLLGIAYFRKTERSFADVI